MIHFDPSIHGGREVAKLGLITIGEVAPHMGGRQVRSSSWMRGRRRCCKSENLHDLEA